MEKAITGNGSGFSATQFMMVCKEQTTLPRLVPYLSDCFDRRGYHRASVLHGRDGFVVTSADRVGAYAGHVFEHLHSIPEVADAASFVVAPGDRDLLDGIAEFAGDEENLRIESPTLDGLEAEDDLGGWPGKGFEAALGVLEGQAHDSAGDPVETAAEELAVKRLVNGLAGAVHPAGTDGDIGAVVDGGDKALGLLHGGGQVGVGEHDDVASGLEETVSDGVAFPAVAGVLNEVQTGVVGHPMLDDGSGVVLGSVVDDEDLGVPALFGDAGGDPFQCVFNT